MHAHIGVLVGVFSWWLWFCFSSKSVVHETSLPTSYYDLTALYLMADIQLVWIEFSNLEIHHQKLVFLSDEVVFETTSLKPILCVHWWIRGCLTGLLISAASTNLWP